MGTRRDFLNGEDADASRDASRVNRLRRQRCGSGVPRLRSAARAGLPPSGVRFFDHATANKRYANGIVADDLGRPLKVSETPPLTSDLFACSVMMVERVLPDRVLGVGRGGARWSLFAPLAITSLRERFPQPLKLTEPGNSHGATLSERV